MVGRIVKGIAGFYYVHDGKTVYECRARGIFRENHEKPLTGDNVLFDVVSSLKDPPTGLITEILDRKNMLFRPEIANVDRIFLLFSANKPEPNYEMLNRYLVAVHDTVIPVSLVVTKCDTAKEAELEAIEEAFSHTAFPIFFISSKNEESIEPLREAMKGLVSALAGPSGVGKSTLINCLLGHEAMETGELSRKIDRGKNTTRHSEIFCMEENTYIFDTPGFSSVDVENIEPENLPLYFDEFVPFVTACRFSSCTHRKEKGCALRQAVRDGEISKKRYLSYTSIYQLLLDNRRY